MVEVEGKRRGGGLIGRYRLKVESKIKKVVDACCYVCFLDEQGLLLTKSGPKELYTEVETRNGFYIIYKRKSNLFYIL